MEYRFHKELMQGTITAMITPFCGGEIDEEGVIENIHTQLVAGVEGIFFFGSTGESSTLSYEEKKKILSLAVEHAKGKVPIWVGTGCNNTHKTIERTQWAKASGADVALVVVPYYNKPTQEGIYRHFEAIAEAVDIPLVLYNVPSRTGVSLETKTLMRIAALPHVVGVKDCSGSLEQAQDFIYALREHHPHVDLFSGDDSATLGLMALGAVGVISVLSNLLPKEIAACVQAALQGDFDEARERHFALLPLYRAMTLETNPIPIKAAMRLLGRAAGECRLPLSPLSEENMTRLKEAFSRCVCVS